MKQIKGKDYYVSLGYIDEEKKKDGVNAKDIQSIFVKSKDNTVIYYDNSDKENVIALPLIPVNEIQRKKDIFKFRVLVSPSKIEYDEYEATKRLNIVGLFSVYRKDNVEYIEHVSFFETNDIIGKYSTSKTLSIEVPVNKILGDK